ncbi:sigma-70 family RNA polymerase sigma factor [Rhodovarius crocodyli]|uniref:Sigma-70 family RNA polymerase sigma factor n=1 Tax=Rhodovarius crocodyli TaxID=1979269 RepID=A0A437M2V7_9PROT|nr:sigma-70 family RNA polymerase sigma factor [Rhodovarius crocodyli]RVT92027.1 sigma-70 family RNA polymerase sigma factor [Rhodovarius crocodyli]
MTSTQDNRGSLRDHLPGLLGPLRAYARSLVRDASAADDLVHDAVLRGLDHADQWREGDDPRAWMFTILRNLWLSGLRRGRRRQALESDLAGEEEARNPSGTGRLELMEALRQLPPLEREALVLGAQGFSIAEAAQLCGVAEGTVKARISRGRARLRANHGHSLS